MNTKDFFEQPESSKSFMDLAVSPMEQLGAYEALWQEKGASFKSIADKFRGSCSMLPSDLVAPSSIKNSLEALDRLQVLRMPDFGVRISGTADFPERLRDAANPLELFYFQGHWDLIDRPAVAVVGSRNATPEGLRRTRKLAQGLVNDGYTVVSGLAEGIDTAAHQAAIEYGGQTIAVIGTSLAHAYPKSNMQLQKRIAEDYLLISQVPFLLYEQQDYRANRNFFPQRNVTMSALTEATIIVEASDTSGTLYQARAAIAQGRKLFILDSCFKNKDISWPQKYLSKGAIRVIDYNDIRTALRGQD